MNKLEKLKLIRKTIAEHKITAYEISQGTKLSSVGVQKIINGKTKNPNENTVDVILDYLENNIVGTNYKEGNDKLNKVEEVTANIFSNPLELLKAYKKQIYLFEKNIDLYEENAGLYRENSNLLRDKITYLSEKLT